MITKALIIQKYWLDKIFNEGKIWEMRTSKTKITGRIGLVESGSGLIVGEVDLLGCLDSPIPADDRYLRNHKVEDIELLKKWKYAWVLSNAKRYENPVPYKHPKGAVIWVNLNHKEIIKCPECNLIQNAFVKHTTPFYTYIHECIKCKYVITESDWEEVKNVKFAKPL